MADKQLTLGTLFSADAKPLFDALNKVKTQLNMIATAAKQLESSLGTMNAAINKGTGHLSTMGSELTDFQKAMGRASGESNKFQQALSLLGSGKSGTALKTVESNLYKVEKAVQQTAQRMNEAGKHGDKFADTANRIALHNQTLAGNLKATATGLQRVSSETSNADKATKTATASYDGMGKSMTNVHGAVERLTHAMKVTASYGLASAAIFGVVTAMKAGVQAIIDYDQSLKNLQAITGATDAEVTTMGETIKSVARDTKFSSTEVAAGMTLLGQAGLSAGESITTMRDTATLATGTMSDMQLVTDLMSTSLRAFNLDASESGRIADVMANAMNKSKLDIDKLRTAFNYVASSAHQAGLSLEETAASMMVLADHGVRASTIGTGLRQVLARVVNPSEKMAGALAQVGLELKDVNPSMSGWEGTLKSLSKVLYDSETKTVNMAKAFDLFGLRGAQAAAILISSYVSGGFSAALKATYEIGSAADMAAKQQEGLGIIIKNLVDRAKNLAIAFGDAGVTGVMKGFLKAVSDGIVALESFASSTMGQTILQVTAFTTAIGLATKAWGAFLAAMSASSVLKIRELALVFTGMSTTLTGKTGLVGSLSLVGSAIANLITKINPFVLAATAAGGAVLAYRNHLENTVKSAELLAVTNMGTVNSLTAFQGALQSTGDKALKLKDNTDLAKGANEAYVATLHRLIEAHPELKNKIQLSTEAIEQNNRVLDEFLGAAHTERLRALINLQSEYNAQMARAETWSGLWNGFKTVLESVYTWMMNLDRAVRDAESAFLSFAAEQTLKLPLIGSLVSTVIEKYQAWSREIANLDAEATQFWLSYFQNLGKGADAAQAAGEKVKGVWDQIAQGFVNAGGEATKSFGAIKRELEAITVEGKTLSAEAIAYIIAKIGELTTAARQQAIEIKQITQDATNEMNADWKAYMDSKDNRGAMEVQNEWERLQKKAKDFADFLAKKYADEKNAAAIIEEELKKFWAQELVAYQEKEDSKLNKTQTRIDKELNAEQTLANKITEMQRKLQADINAIEEAGMSQRELSKKHELEAYTAVEEAKKAIAIASAEGATKAQIQAAFDAVEAARKALAEVSADSKKTSEDVQGHAKEAATFVSGSMKGMADQNKDTWNTVSTTISSSISDTTDKHKKSADAIKDELTGITSKTQAENKEWRDESGRTKEQIIADWKAAAENIGKEITSVTTEAGKLTIVWKKVNEDGSVSLGSWTNALTTLKDKSIPSVKGALEGLITELGKIKTKAEEDKTLKLDAEKAKKDVGDVDQKATNVKKNVETPKTLSVNTTTANTNLTGIQTLLNTITTTVWNAALTIATTGAEAVTAAKNTLVETAKEWASSLVITVTGLADLVSALAYHRALDGLRTDSYHTVHVDYEGSGSTTKPLGEKAKEVDGWLRETQAIAGEGATFTVAFEGESENGKGSISEKIQEIKDFVASLPEAWQEMFNELKGQYKLDFYEFALNTKSKADELSEFMANTGSSQEEITNELEKLYGDDLTNFRKELREKAASEAEALQNSVDDNQSANDEKLNSLRRTLDGMNDEWQKYAKTLSGVYLADFFNFASQTQAKVDSVALAMQLMGRSEEDIAAAKQAIYDGDLKAFQDQLTQKVDANNTANDTMAKGVSESAGIMADSFTSAVQGMISAINNLIAKLGELAAAMAKTEGHQPIIRKETTWDAFGPHVTMTAIDPMTGETLWVRHFKKGGTVDAIRQMDENGGRLSRVIAPFAGEGKLPGFGGGDTVPALLERGEYVMRKEAVQSYGTGLMNAINSGMAKFMAGGIVKPQIVFDQPVQRFATGGQVASATSMYPASSSGVPINITLSPMFMTGDKNSMRQAAETLRTELKNIDHRYGVA